MESRPQPELNHPDAAAELQHFHETLEIVRGERQKAETALGIIDGNDKLIQVIDDGSGEAVVQQFVTRMKLRQLHQLRLSEKRPYFARLDFAPDGASDKQVTYLGRWGVLRTPGYQICVADWRSPVANLYYSGQIGRVSYDAPDGAVHGELSLKRMFTVEDGVLESIIDTGLLGQEQYLTDVLSQGVGNRLREIVTTIQAEQNLVIRFQPDAPLLVQGVAGSGKTTIALHRIAWILYRLQKTLAPHQLMILAPNPLFLNYISRVLPDLGVDEVRQTTFPLLCAQLLGKRMPRMAKTARLEERLQMNQAQRDALDAVLRQKGALSLYGELQRYGAELETRLLPETDVQFGGRTVATVEEIREMNLRQFRHFPLDVRRQETRKVIVARMKRIADGVREALVATTAKRLDTLLASMPDGEERRGKATRLLQSRDQRMVELDEAQKAFLRQYDAQWHSTELLTLYGEFWTELSQRDASFAAACDATLRLLAKKQVASEDLPALLILADVLYGLKELDVKHIVIDEAQDVSPLQVKALRERVCHDAFTLVGDLWQGIHGDEGIRSWNELGQGIFETTPTTAMLSTSYRSTCEIVQLAFSVLARHPMADVPMAKPVLRHGEAPTLQRLTKDAERPAQIAKQVRAWQKEAFHSIAILVKKETDAKRLHQALTMLLPDAKLVTQGDAAYEGGVMVLCASLIKGLEFDCVLVADADEKTYPDDSFYAKLFYVICTRPLHRLHFISVGVPCSHLAALESAESSTGLAR